MASPARGQHEITARVGEGGTGKVYNVRHVLLGCAGGAVIALLLAAAVALLAFKPWQRPTPGPPEASARATLSIVSTTSGAWVTIDDRAVGQTPLELEVSPGVHEVLVRKAGCTERSETVEAISGESIELGFDLDCPQQHQARRPPPPRSTGPGSLGISGRSVDRETQLAFGLATAEGTLVDQVSEGSGDLAPGDVILGVNGRPVPNFEELSALVAGSSPGTRLELEVLRNGRRITVPVTVLSRRIDMIIPGLGVGDTADGLAGAVVTRVEPDSPPAVAGLMVGDVIQRVGNRPVSNADQFADALWSAQQPGSSVHLGVHRPREGRSFEVEVLF